MATFPSERGVPDTTGASFGILAEAFSEEKGAFDCGSDTDATLLLVENADFSPQASSLLSSFIDIGVLNEGSALTLDMLSEKNVLDSGRGRSCEIAVATGRILWTLVAL